MKYFSMFSGIGTGEKGIEQAFNNQYEPTVAGQTDCESGRFGSAGVGRDGVLSANDSALCNGGGQGMLDCVGFSEIDKHAEAVYRYHYDHRNYGDATGLVPESLPDFDFLIAGFPCQAFSIAGKRQGFDDARGTLFFEIARVLSHKRPSHFLLENVGGLRSHDGGKTIQRLLGILADLGYFVEVPLLNSKDYGVPQNRERVFFIGHLGERCEREVLSIGQDGAGIIERPEQAAIANCFTAGGHSGGMHSSMTLLEVGNVYADKPNYLSGKSGYDGGRVYNPSGVSSTLKSLGGGMGAKTGLYAVDTKNAGPARFTENVACLGANDYKEPKAVSDGTRIRRLTPIECERLQGLPDNYTALGRYGDEVKPVSDTQRYKGLGNSFTVNVIEALITRMREKGCLRPKPEGASAN